MLKRLRIEIEDWLYATALPHFVLAKDLPQAWAFKVTKCCLSNSQ